MNEGMLVSDLQSRDPPALHIWMISICHMDASPATHQPLIAVIEVLDAMEIVEVPKCRSMLSIYFERVERFVAARVSCRFKRRERSIAEPAEKCAGIVDSNLFDFTGEIMFPLFNERLGHRHDFGDRTIKPHCRVNVMSEQIPGHPAASNLNIQPP